MQQENNQSPAAENTETKIGAVTITQYPNEKTPHTIIELALTKRVKTFLIGADLNRCEGIISSDVQINISIIFRLIEFLGVLGYSGDYDGMEIGEYQSVLGLIGKMLTESLEDIGYSFERHKYIQSNPLDAPAPENETPLADQSQAAIAKHLSALIGNPNISVELHNLLGVYVTDLQNDFPVDSADPKVLENLLIKKAAGGAK